MYRHPVYITHLIRLLSLFALLLLLGFRWSLLFGDPTWEKIEATLRSDFPELSHITTSELKQLMENKEDIVLVDVREAEEFQVSHLKNAILVEEFQPQTFAKTARIVTYCSVGLRSAAYARKLQKRGFLKVQNLQGSIFEWANRGYPLYRNEARAHTVHSYNTRWGTLLDARFHDPKLP